MDRVQVWGKSQPGMADLYQQRLLLQAKGVSWQDLLCFSQNTNIEFA